VPNGDRFLVLLKGRRYIGAPGSAEYRIIEFDKYGLRIEASEAKEYLPSVKSLPTAELFGKKSADAARRADLAHGVAAERAGAVPDGDSNELRQPACGTLAQS